MGNVLSLYVLLIISHAEKLVACCGNLGFLSKLVGDNYTHKGKRIAENRARNACARSSRFPVLYTICCCCIAFFHYLIKESICRFFEDVTDQIFGLHTHILYFPLFFEE